MANSDQPATPTSDPSSRAGEPFEEVIRLATLQRHLNLAVLANLVVASFLGGLAGGIPIALRVLAGVATAFFSVITAIRIANTLHGRKWAFICALLMFVPFVNLLVLLALSSGTTKRLREEGITVGFLGANPVAVRARIEAARTECVHCAEQIRDEKTADLCKACKRLVHSRCRKAHRTRAHPKAAQADA